MSFPIIDILSFIVIGCGCFFIATGSIGLVRMPDLYTRLHATSIIDTVGAGLLLLGMMFQAGFTLITVKLIILLVLFFFTGPVASHALAQAARHDGIEPILTDTPADTAKE